ncbi:MAG: glycosyltransferase [Alphaproteobacteria bacterium]|nr:glycosyltransferase [Alphaproteobacteria bacterium]
MSIYDPMRVMFVHTEQYTPWKDELFFNHVRLPVSNCGIKLEVYDFVRNHRKAKNEIDFDEEGQRFLKEVKLFRPDLIIYSHSWYDIQDIYWKEIKKDHIPVFTIMWDTLLNPALTELNIIKYSDHIAVYDSVFNFFRYRLFFDIFRDNRSCVLFGCGYQVMPEIFLFKPLKKIYDVALLGSGEGQRLEIIRHLKEKADQTDINFYKLGGLVNSEIGSHEKGLTDGWMSLDQYIDVINQTKILICSQTRPERIQVKGKIFEFLSCKGFCLIDRNFEYESLIPPGCVAYFDSTEDLWEKINYYIANPEEREKIANAGHQWYIENFKYKEYWSKFLCYVAGRSTEYPSIPTLEARYRKIQENGIESLINVSMKHAAEIIKGNEQKEEVYSGETKSSCIMEPIPPSIKALTKTLIKRIILKFIGICRSFSTLGGCHK